MRLGSVSCDYTNALPSPFKTKTLTKTWEHIKIPEVHNRLKVQEIQEVIPRKQRNLIKSSVFGLESDDVPILCSSKLVFKKTEYKQVATKGNPQTVSPRN